MDMKIFGVIIMILHTAIFIVRIANERSQRVNAKFRPMGEND